MSEDKDDLKSIKVYRFNNTKESWHEFALKFRVIADYRGYDDIISGKEIAPSEKENLEINNEDDELTKKSKKAKQSARMANRKGFRDLVISTDGISLNIVQNSTSDKLSKGDLKKAWGRLERRWNPNSNFGKLMDLGNNSVCEECAMICTDVYSTDESEGMIVYGDQGISSEKYDEETYGDLLNTDSDDEQVIKYNVALLATDSVSLEKK